MPRNQQPIRVGQLPDIAATPMADRLAGAKPCELGEATPGDVGLPM